MWPEQLVEAGQVGTRTQLQRKKGYGVPQPISSQFLEGTVEALIASYGSMPMTVKRRES